jgi:hypothetical protein
MAAVLQLHYQPRTVVKALLSGNNCTLLQQQLGEAIDEQGFKVWREWCTTSKLHNTVYYITRSDSRWRAFEAAQKVDSSYLKFQLVRNIGVR